MSLYGDGVKFGSPSSCGQDQAQGESEYCDVYIGIPVLKSHGLCGTTGALKLHWGSMLGLLEKQEHAGYGFGTGDIRMFLDYLCAMNRARGFDLVIMDALTGNRSGPANKVEDKDAKTDFILVNAILCSERFRGNRHCRDASLRIPAGFGSLLESAFRDGIGINKPAHIDLLGFDAFANHKQWLREHYPGCEARSYPFENGWGNAKIQDDFNPPVDAKASCKRGHWLYVRIHGI